MLFGCLVRKAFWPSRYQTVKLKMLSCVSDLLISILSVWYQKREVCVGTRVCVFGNSACDFWHAILGAVFWRWFASQKLICSFLCIWSVLGCIKFHVFHAAKTFSLSLRATCGTYPSDSIWWINHPWPLATSPNAEFEERPAVQRLFSD